SVYAVNTAFSRPHVVMSLQLAGLALKGCLSYCLILGGLGLPPMGAVGGAVASVVVFWAMFLMGFGYMHRSAFYGRFVLRWAWPRWVVLREILHLGIPMSLSYALEATSFTAITLLAARLGTTVMGGHQVVAKLGALGVMFHRHLLARGTPGHDGDGRPSGRGQPCGAVLHAAPFAVGGHRNAHRP